ncbi:hypothetical protein FNH05_16400 [Amycolatopsis rhizosphaerae]|uniref:Uncharacterized protein n=1 Tax=Amycolatopsis rhizosphaerae TaxID=2053003 RepID=A0A558CMB4_9PSEU|nr:hypothetical protein [Amycolatopsis rhizosphaerae]TVT49927.1 hypothetical protein FNH05_16400 [Amycolatopsis rhizosphaerae]
MSARTVGALALADFRERVRRPSYLAILVGAAGLACLAAPPADARWVILDAGGYRGLYNSAYLGTVTALAGGLWLTLAGFFLVRGTVDRDERSGVGALLAATPLRTSEYLGGKFLSNLLVLSSMTGVLAATALVLQLVRGESTAIDPAALLLPFALITLPLLAVTAAGALLFDSAPPVRAGLGNIVWFFGWLVFVVAGQSGPVLGMRAVGASMRAEQAAPDSAEFGLGLMYLDHPLQTFVWPGLAPDASFVLIRLALLLAAGVPAFLPALWFDRFDPARGPAAAPQPSHGASTTPLNLSRPRTAVRAGSTMGRLFAGEFRILVQGVRPWWWLALAVLTVASLAVTGVAPGSALAVTWVWPVVLWSRLGAQRHENGVTELTEAAPAGHRRVVAEWVAGLVLTALTGSGPLLRLVLAGDGAGMAAWTGAALAIPSLALALGEIGRTQRLFQAVYLPVWYLAVNGFTAPPPVVAGAAFVLAVLAFGAHLLRHQRR